MNLTALRTYFQKNRLIVTFLSRYWILLLVTLVTNFLTVWKHVFVWVPAGKDEWGNVVWQGLTLFDICGAILSVPGLCSAVLFCALFARHIVFRSTIDSDIHDGTYVTDWKAASPNVRIICATAILAILVLAFAVIGAALAK